MKFSEVEVGLFVKVREDEWQEWCFRHQNEYTPFKPQPITDVRDSGPYKGFVMLAYPFYWWQPEELEKM